ncbi:MAG: hypothetical protein D6714_20605 [Bacteroidetes bacterium]|nr:MAG: hypothetical protein D6714_20605 [Bacteroidota bacterium]
MADQQVHNQPNPAPISQNEKLAMRRLRQILLRDDRAELEYLRRVVDDPVLLSEKVNPIIEEQLDFFKRHFPKEFHAAVEKIVDVKLKASQEELLEVIYPTLGKMIKKYIQHQFQMLKESMEAQIRETLNTGILGRIRYALFGAPSEALTAQILRGMDQTVIEEIFVIEHHSGILLGSASRSQKVDIDMIAGMLTAIKAFVEDAFNRGEEDLEMVQYGTFSILLQSFPAYYIAIALTGALSAQEKDKLVEAVLTFVEKELTRIPLKKEDGTSNQLIRQKLEHYFIHPQKAILPKKTITQSS